jgi:transposase
MKIEAKSAGALTGGENGTLYGSVEMGSTGWLLTSRLGGQDRVQRRRVASNDWRATISTLRRQQKACGAQRVVCCYEAGREGFWPYRALQAAGIETYVLDPASIAVNQRGRRTKTDRIDGVQEVDAVEALELGLRTAARAVVVPSEEQEEARQLSRTRSRLVKERTALITYIKSGLARVGVDLPPATQPGWREQLAKARQWDGERPLPRQLVRDIELSHERLMLVCRQIGDLEDEQRIAVISCQSSGKRRLIKTRQAAQAWDAQASPAQRRLADQAERLSRLVSIAPVTGYVLAGEVYWRDFRNRRQVGGYVGLGGAQRSSGKQQRELGISKAGNRRARHVLVEVAWTWVEHQPDSPITQWFRRRAPKGASPRQRRVAIVAVARKLAVALWYYLNDGVVPQGARMKD